MQKKGLAGAIISIIATVISSAFLFYISLIFGILFAFANSGFLSNVFPYILLTINVLLGVTIIVLNILCIRVFAKPECRFTKSKGLLIALMVLKSIIIIEIALIALRCEGTILIVLSCVLLVVLLISFILYVLEYISLSQKYATKAPLEQSLEQQNIEQNPNNSGIENTNSFEQKE